MTAPPISMVVCTHNRAPQLAAFLQHLTQLEGPPGSELILVDNASTDETRQLLDAFEAPAGMTAVILSEPTAGKGCALNTGWRAANASVVAFTGDDCYVEPDLLTSMVRLFDENPSVGCIGGRIVLHDATDLPMSIILRATPAQLEPGQFARAGFVMGANLAVRRGVLEQVGGFDPMFGPGTPFVCEDVDIAAAVLEHGWKLLYHPEPTVRHHHGRRYDAERVALEQVYDMGRGAYYAKYLLQSRNRWTVAKAWLRGMRTLPMARTAVEVRAALQYAFRRLMKP